MRDKLRVTHPLIRTGCHLYVIWFVADFATSYPNIVACVFILLKETEIIPIKLN